MARVGDWVGLSDLIDLPPVWHSGYLNSCFPTVYRGWLGMTWLQIWLPFNRGTFGGFGEAGALHCGYVFQLADNFASLRL